MQEMQETWVQYLGQEDPLEKELTTHSSILFFFDGKTMGFYIGLMTPQLCV